jgi:hypothetical protein
MRPEGHPGKVPRFHKNVNHSTMGEELDVKRAMEQLKSRDLERAIPG